MDNRLKSLGLASLLTAYSLLNAGCEKKPQGTAILVYDSHPLVVFTGKLPSSYAAVYNTNDLLITKAGKVKAKELGVDESELIKYSSSIHIRSGFDGIEKLIKAGVKADVATQYSPYFRVEDVVYLHNNGVTPEMAAPYDPFLDSINIEYFAKRQIDPKKVNPFAGLSQRVWAEQIEKLASVMTREQFDEYKQEHLVFDDMIRLAKANISIATYKSYEGGLNPSLIIEFREKGITPEMVKKYLNLNTTYGTNIKPWDIPTLIESKVPFEELEKMAKGSKVERILFGK